MNLLDMVPAPMLSFHKEPVERWPASVRSTHDIRAAVGGQAASVAYEAANLHGGDMRKKNVLVLAMTAVLVIASGVSAGSLITIRPYGRIGTLLNEPSANDLDYSGENLDQYLDLTKTNYGAGAQLLLGTGVPTVSMGIDLGFQKLLKYNFDAGAASISADPNDHDSEDEWDSYLLLTAELSPPVLPVFLQAGAGPHFVFSSLESVRAAIDSGNPVTDASKDAQFGLMGALGINLKAAPTLSIPIMLRVDYLTGHGGQAAIALAAGLSLSI